METQTIRITKEFEFEAAHSLDGYDGKCKDIHGHSYKLAVTLKGKVNQDIHDPKCGMVIDFGDIKSVVKEKVVSKFDHYLVLRSDSRFKGIEEKGERIRFVDYQPTCENMLLEIVVNLKKAFEPEGELIEVVLRETSTGSATWCSSDNE